MSSRLKKATFGVFAALSFAALFSAHGAGALAEVLEPQPVIAVQETPNFVAQPVVQVVTETIKAAETTTVSATDAAEAMTASSLNELVAAHEHSDDLSREMDCLATAIYFESKGESLEGQLAVGRVIIARSESGRFPSSYCGVVLQRSQFSFVRGGALPSVKASTRQWKNAVAIAHIAHNETWDSPVEGALFFHATHVAPRWRLNRMARIDNHIFYR